MIYAVAFTSTLQQYNPYSSATAYTEAAFQAHCAVKAFRIAQGDCPPKDDESYETLHAFARRA